MTKRILHVVNISFVLPYYIGEQFDNFQTLGIKTYVACTPSNHLQEYSVQKNFTPISVNIFREINPIADFKAILFLRKEIIKEKIDIVVGHTPKGAMIAMVASYFAGVKQRIYFRHGLMYETSKGIKRRLLKGIERLTAGLATKVVCVSESVKQLSESQKLGNPKKNILLNKGTCNGLNSVKFSRDSISLSDVEALKLKYNVSVNDIVVGYVGRIVKDKGINELLSAWKILTSKYDNLKLLLVGPFEERDSIGSSQKEYITSNSSIIHTGLIDDVTPLYMLMDMFVLPSYREGFPTVILEASAMELPIITTRSTGCLDAIIENETGIFSEIEGNALMRNIEFYLLNKDIGKQHGINGRKFVVENFDQNIVWKAIEKQVFEIKA